MNRDTDQAAGTPDYDDLFRIVLKDRVLDKKYHSLVSSLLKKQKEAKNEQRQKVMKEVHKMVMK